MMQALLAKLTFWRLAFVAVFVVGSYATLVRFGRGLGAASGLSDAFPWGLWIGFDVMCGVALAAGGFTIAATVYVLRLRKFEPILRPTVLTAFLGYLLVSVSLMYDLGRPYRIWHPVVWGNPHSVMFEVAWCVMLYLTVLALEFSPVVLERLKFSRALKVMHSVTPLLVICGVILSTLHQSSLGTLYVIAPDKLHGLWYTPFLPVLFWISAIAVGLSMTIFESTLSHRAFGVSLHRDIVGSLGKAIAVVLGVYLVVRFGTLAARGSLPLLWEGSTESRLFWLEILLGVVAPMGLFSLKRVRASSQGLFYSAVFVILGVVLNRLNVSITGMERYAGNVYFPTFLEAATTVFVLGCGFFAFAVIVRYFAVFPASSGHGAVAMEDAPMVRTRSPVATPQGAFVLVVLLCVFGGIALYNRIFDRHADVVVTTHQVIAQGPRKLDLAGNGNPTLNLPPDYEFPRASTSPGPVVFSHERHITWNANACTNCHPKPYKMAAMDIAVIECEYGRMGGCGQCHDGSASFDIKKACRLCHQRMGEGAGAPGSTALSWRLADRLMATSDREFGPVFFSHARHVTQAKIVCADCHPGIYKMRRTEATDPTLKDREAFIEWGHRCKICHDGQRAFAQADKCGKCHVRWSRGMAAADCPAPSSSAQAL
jgi:c(7)-type cytochrome triheme protein